MSRHVVSARLLVIAAIALVPPRSVAADEALVAVATNFSTVARALETAFEAATPHDLRLASGSTGKLYAQIVNGAPFDVFLAADRERPRRLLESGRALEGSRRTYARGRLVLWSADAARVDEEGDATLRRGAFRRLAIAQPELAPYGLAARETLASLGLLEALTDRLVMGENIGQTFTIVATGNAELGFVAASQVAGEGALSGSGWSVPARLHAPIRQDVVLLARAAENPAARAFLDFLASPPARRLIRASGYEVD